MEGPEAVSIWDVTLEDSMAGGVLGDDCVRWGKTRTALSQSVQMAWDALVQGSALTETGRR